MIASAGMCERVCIISRRVESKLVPTSEKAEAPATVVVSQWVSGVVRDWTCGWRLGLRGGLGPPARTPPGPCKG